MKWNRALLKWKPISMHYIVDHHINSKNSQVIWFYACTLHSTASIFASGVLSAELIMIEGDLAVRTGLREEQ